VIRTDVNTVHLAGTVTSSKLWDPRPGNSLTNGSVTLDTGDARIRLSVTVSTEGNFDEVSAFKNMFKQGASVVLLNSFFAGYERNKDGKKEYIYKLDSRISGAAVSDGSRINSACVSGTVLQQAGKGLVVSAQYKTRGSNPEIRSRQVKVKLTEVNGTNMKGKRGVFLGKVVTTDNGAYLDCTGYTTFS